jgi:hypothetical protein
METALLTRHVWRCHCLRTRLPVTVVYYQEIQAWEASTSDAALMRRLYRFLGKGSNYQKFYTKMQRIPRLGLRLRKFCIFPA